MKSKKILVINAGSSSMKWSLYTKDKLEIIASGISERIGINNSFLTMDFDSKKIKKEIDLKDHLKSVEQTVEMWQENQVISDLNEIEIVGFRVVHGGQFFTDTTELKEVEIKKIDELSKFAPLHNPGALLAINAIKKVIPNAKLSATFDTAFHTSIPEVNAIYPIKKELSEKYGIRKYGFHGSSHKFITQKLSEILNKKIVNLVNLHIGSGASLCAIKNSKSIDTSMGMTPLAGIMMGTRSGDIDPSIHEYIMEQANISIKEFTNILNKESGLLGVSKIGSDLRDVIAKYQENDKDAILALELYSQKIADYLINYINKVGKEIDALVFTAGVGENSSFMREMIINKINILDLKLDTKLNNTSPKDIKESILISSSDSSIPIYVIRTNEELMIAEDAKKLFN
ncbi:acetate/propionate family kinase [[Mycoplasma] collis]|uniref:acetate/propionate family kinase n=1 Tax=[Mycoplasma] collis TaxID=2127 RepID=UPI00051C66B2|nr:acetate/propionate family kinase [[Mycoplasma] collis]